MKNRITYYQRKLPQNNGSVEGIFNCLRKDIEDFFNFNVKVMRYYSSSIFKVIFNMLDSIRSQSDINHITGDIQYVAIFLKKNKTILTILDCVYLENSFGLKHFLFKYLFLIFPIKRVKYITTISEYSKKSILNYYPTLNPDRIYVIPISVSNNFRYHYKDFNSISPRLLQIGTAENKNVLNLITAIKNINCKLILIGKLSIKIQSSLYENRIHYENFFDISEFDLIQQYEKSDIVTFVSTYEGFGLPIIEANAIGRCVITSNRCSMPEIANDAACIVDPTSILSIRNGILMICNNPLYRNNLIQNGLVNVKRFDKKIIHNQYLTLYQNLISKRDNIRN